MLYSDIFPKGHPLYGALLKPLGPHPFRAGLTPREIRLALRLMGRTEAGVARSLGISTPEVTAVVSGRKRDRQIARGIALALKVHPRAIWPRWAR